MMTPNTYAGHLTEKVMANIVRKIGRMPNHNYNAIYGAVLGILSEEFDRKPFQPNQFLPADIAQKVTS